MAGSAGTFPQVHRAGTTEDPSDRRGPLGSRTGPGYWSVVPRVTRVSRDQNVPSNHLGVQHLSELTLECSGRIRTTEGIFQANLVDRLEHLRHLPRSPSRRTEPNFVGRSRESPLGPRPKSVLSLRAFTPSRSPCPDPPGRTRSGGPGPDHLAGAGPGLPCENPGDAAAV